MRLNLLKIFKKKDNHEPDLSLLWAFFALLLIGLVILFSASSVIAYDSYGTPYHFFKKQLLFLSVGLVVFFIFAWLDYRIWKKFALYFLIGSIILLLLVFIPGLKVKYGTAQSWVNFFGLFSFQPSELVKLFFLLYLATWLEAKKLELKNLTSGFIPFLFILFIIAFLMLRQPDIGTLFIIAVSAVIVFFVSGGPIKHLLFLGAMAGIALFFLINNFSDYQVNRFKCLKDPGYSLQNECYQINQSLIAVGSGGLFGRGLGQSRQKFMYLPEVWGDAIFAIAAEEVGFLFSVLLILLYLFIFYRGFIIAKNAPDIYGTALATGIVCWLAIQTFLNIGGMINLIPITGVPLPFISAGGSALVSGLIAMGILVNISRHTKKGYARH